MIHPIESVQIIANDLPDYVEDCNKEDVSPLINRPNGWTEVISADIQGEVDVEIELLDPMYGEETIKIKPNLVVTVAVYGSVEVA